MGVFENVNVRIHPMLLTWVWCLNRNLKSVTASQKTSRQFNTRPTLCLLTSRCFFRLRHALCLRHCATCCTRWGRVAIYPHFVHLCGERDGGPVQRQVLFVAVHVAHQLHQCQGAAGAHGQPMVLRPGERLQSGHRRHERHDRLPFKRRSLRARERTVRRLRLRLDNNITGQWTHRFWQTDGCHVFCVGGKWRKRRREERKEGLPPRS